MSIICAFFYVRCNCRWRATASLSQSVPIKCCSVNFTQSMSLNVTGTKYHLPCKANTGSKNTLSTHCIHALYLEVMHSEWDSLISGWSQRNWTAVVLDKTSLVIPSRLHQGISAKQPSSSWLCTHKLSGEEDWLLSILVVCQDLAFWSYSCRARREALPRFMVFSMN